MDREKRQIRKPWRYFNSIAYVVDSSGVDPVTFALAMADGAVGDKPCTNCNVVESKESK